MILLTELQLIGEYGHFLFAINSVKDMIITVCKYTELNFVSLLRIFYSVHCLGSGINLYTIGLYIIV